MMKKNFVLLTSLSLFTVGCFKNESRSSKRLNFDGPKTEVTEEVDQPVEDLDQIGVTPKTLETIIVAIEAKNEEEAAVASAGDTDTVVEKEEVPTIEDGTAYDDTNTGTNDDTTSEETDSSSSTDDETVQDEEASDNATDDTEEVVIDLDQDLESLIAQLEKDKVELQAEIDKILEKHGFLKTLRDGWETILQYLFQEGSFEIETAIENDVNILLETEKSFSAAIAVVDAEISAIDSAIAYEQEKKALYSDNLINSLSDLKKIDAPSTTESALITSIEAFLSADAELKEEKKTLEVALEKRDSKLSALENLKASKEAKQDRLNLYAALLDSLNAQLDTEAEIEVRVEIMSDIQAVEELVTLDNEAIVALDLDIAVAEQELNNAERNVQISDTLVEAKTAELTTISSEIAALSSKADSESIAKMSALEKRKQELKSQRAQLQANLEQAKLATAELSKLLDAVREAKSHVTG